jgi:hypothetical protein
MVVEGQRRDKLKEVKFEKDPALASSIPDAREL